MNFVNSTMMIVLMMLSGSLFSQISDDLFIVIDFEDKYGVVDEKGNILLSSQFDIIRNLSEGYFSTNIGAREVEYELVGGTWKYFDTEGNQSILTEYEDAKDFGDGLAPVKLNGKYGYIDYSGEIIIDYKYEDANTYNNGLASVKIDGKWGFINREGVIVVKPTFDDVRDFNEGFSIVFCQTDRYEYEDDGVPFVEIVGKYGLIDTNGDVVIDTVYDYIGELENGYAQIHLNEKKGVIDSTGKIIIPPKYHAFGTFSGGLAAVGLFMVENSVTGELEQIKDTYKISRKLDGVTDSTKIASIRKELMDAIMFNRNFELLYGYVDINDNTIIDFQFTDASNFINGVAAVKLGFIPMVQRYSRDEINKKRKNNGYNLIDLEGNYLFDEVYDIVNHSNDGTVVVYNNRIARDYYPGLRTFGRLTYNSLMYLGDGLFYGKEKESGSNYLINDSGRFLLDNEITKVRSFFDDKILVEYKSDLNGEKVIKAGIIDRKGAWIFKSDYKAIYKMHRT